MRVKLKYVTADPGRDGVTRYYYRRPGQPKIRLRGDPGSPEFMAAYQSALRGEVAIAAAPQRLLSRSDTGSLAWLVRQFFDSAHYKHGIGGLTRDLRRRNLERVLMEPLSSEDTTPIGTLPYAGMTSAHIRKLRDRKAATPGAASALLQNLSALFGWAISVDLATVNPVKGVKRITSSKEGWHAWSEDEIRQYADAWPIGGCERLALALMLYTGQRRSDVIRFGPGHIKGSCFVFTQHKNRERYPLAMTVPVLPALLDIIARTETGAETFLIDRRGNPFTERSFSQAFKGWCRKAGVPENCSSHGLRKAAAERLAEGGATASQIMAICGWRTMGLAQHYTQGAEQKTMARAAIDMLVR